VIETITHAGQDLAYIVHGSERLWETTFVTPPDLNLQVGFVVYGAGQEIPRHMHLPVERHIDGTMEVLVVRQGRCEVDVYSESRELAATRELRAGDVLIAVAGGHGFRALEKLVLLEVKQGPYPGVAEKERF
jgi:mannose-6-phosphate isomerase-like protein (cupin superfamily)